MKLLDNEYGFAVESSDKSLAATLVSVLLLPGYVAGFVFAESVARGFIAIRKTFGAVADLDPKATLKHTWAVARYVALGVAAYTTLRIVSYGLDVLALKAQERIADKVSEHTAANDDLIEKATKVAVTAGVGIMMYAAVRGIQRYVSGIVEGLTEEFHEASDSMWGDEPPTADDLDSFAEDPDARPDGGQTENDPLDKIDPWD